MNHKAIETSELTEEKGIWDIYKQSRKIPFSNWNLWSTVCVFLLLSIQAFLAEWSTNEIAEIVREFALTGLSVSLGVLGFLIAGFTIFATISQPKLSIVMAENIQPVSGLSYLKHSYFTIIRVFIYYIVYAVFCLFIIAFGQSKGLVSVLLYYSSGHEHIEYCLLSIGYVLLFAGLFFLLMQLKSFIFNIYHSVMTALRYQAEGWDD